ncbi:MAG: hypothetical protein Q9224_002514 [Gallowayella concinna]
MNEDDPRAFELFVQWLYTGKLFMSSNEASTEYEINRKVKVPEVQSFASTVWALGDKLVCPAFQDHAMLLLLAHLHKEFLDKYTAQVIYRVCPPGSRLRMLAVDQFLWDIGLSQFGGKMWDCPDGGIAHDIGIADFTEDVAKRLIEKRGERQDPSEIGSRYLQVLKYENYKKDVQDETVGEGGSDEE